MVKDPSANAENAGGVSSVSGTGRPLEEEMVSTPVFFLGNPVDINSWWATAPRVTKSWTWLSMHSQFCLKGRTGKEKGKGYLLKTYCNCFTFYHN